MLLRAAVLPSQPPALILLKALEGIKQRAHVKNRAAFEGIRPERLMADFSGTIGKVTRAQPETSETLRKLAHTSIAAVPRRANRVLRHASNDGLQELYQTRTQVKRLRYLLEFFSPVSGKKDIKRIRRLGQLQDALGKLNDVIAGVTYISQVPVRPECTIAHELFMQWLREEKKARRRAAIAASGHLPCEC